MRDPVWDPINGPIPPMLAIPGEMAFDSPEHLFEIKWDGYRAIAFLGTETRLQSRRLRNITGEFPELADLHSWVCGGRVTLDGEIVVMKGGRPDFQALQGREGRPIYVAFDILAMNGVSLVDRPLVERKRMLTAGVRSTTVGAGGGIIVTPFFPGRGVLLFEAAVERGLEGIVAKSAASPYLPGARTAHWKKIRRRRTVDCVIGGVSGGAGSPLGSLALGLFAGRELIYVGHVGTGFSEDERIDLLRSFTFTSGIPFTIETHRLPLEFRNTRWVKPDIVCEVSYTEITGGLRLRHPSYQRLRRDKPPSECTFDQIEDAGRLGISTRP